MFTIYKHTNTVTGKSYIGYTSLTMEERWKQHINNANSYKTTFTHKLWNSLRKYGSDCWNHKNLDFTFNEQEAKQKEIAYIQEYNSFEKGYNSTIGGDGVMSGRKHTPEAIEKIKEASRGRIFTKDRCRKISESKLGKKRSPEMIARMRTSLMGKKQSEETKRKKNAAVSAAFTTERKLQTSKRFSKLFKIISPQNEIFIGKGLKQWCAENKKTYHTFKTSASKNRPILYGKHKGWQVNYE